MKMKKPKIYHGGAGDPLVYYTVVLWPRGGGHGKHVSAVYKTARGAENKARAEMAGGAYSGAAIRREEVWYRDDNNEFSSSSPVKTI